jgi:hypothetical protein
MPLYTVRSRLAELAAEHQPPLSIADITEMTGVSLGTVRRWYYNDHMDRYDRETLLAFYQYFQLTALDQLLQVVLVGQDRA